MSISSALAADRANIKKQQWTERLREILDITRYDSNEKRLRVLVEREVEKIESFEFSE